MKRRVLWLLSKTALFTQKEKKRKRPKRYYFERHYGSSSSPGHAKQGKEKIFLPLFSTSISLSKKRRLTPLAQKQFPRVGGAVEGGHCHIPPLFLPIKIGGVEQTKKKRTSENEGGGEKRESRREGEDRKKKRKRRNREENEKQRREREERKQSHCHHRKLPAPQPASLPVGSSSSADDSSHRRSALHSFFFLRLGPCHTSTVHVACEQWRALFTRDGLSPARAFGLDSAQPTELGRIRPS